MTIQPLSFLLFTLAVSLHACGWTVFFYRVKAGKFSLRAIHTQFRLYRRRSKIWLAQPGDMVSRILWGATILLIFLFVLIFAEYYAG